MKIMITGAAGFIGGLAVFALIAWFCLKGLRRLRGVSNHQSWRFALTGLQRRPGATIMQIVALSLGLMALLLLTGADATGFRCCVRFVNDDEIGAVGKKGSAAGVALHEVHAHNHVLVVPIDTKVATRQVSFQPR